MAEPARAVETGGAPETEGGSPQGPSLDHRLGRLEDEVRDIKEILRTDVVPYLRQIGDMKADIAVIKATLPHLATKEDVATCKTELIEKIGKVETDLGTRINKAETDLGEKIGRVEVELGAKIGKVEVELGARIGKVEADLGAKISEVKGMVARTPTALQLAGFVVAIFVASGLIRWVFGP